MTYEEIKNIISQGEGMNIEFKKSTTDITKDVYETVCAFSNREGGHILLGVKDDGTVIGVDRNRAERIKSDFVTSINNPNKIYPPLYLTIENIEYDDTPAKSEKNNVVLQIYYLTLNDMVTSEENDIKNFGVIYL